MKMWTLHYNGLKAGIPDVIWRLSGELDLYLVMRMPYLRYPIIGYSMTRCPHGQEMNMESVLFVEDKTPTEFEQIFHAIYPFPLPKDVREKYDMMIRTAKIFE